MDASLSAAFYAEESKAPVRGVSVPEPWSLEQIIVTTSKTFTSNKSMETEVLVDAEPVVDSSQQRYRAASAFFTYVSLSQEGKSLPVPQLVPETEDEKKRFEEGKGRYLKMKAKQQGQAEPQP
ncbi:PREDICTED: cytosolic acyl coenzyme A thioester hydrolase-like [Elephantulus edwardii]|uniref:cytosolic acyl coenzyme A thioester hydrolase-like n=1 Tax=Elephantulus edwardii TaxID=28737 RepID=UPI0003F0922D|nr:PREDICTED: cytosolic acyl coenzyme A thioester hydrolase-like [Elephantulus edwardii]